MKLLVVAVCIFVVANGQLDKLRENFHKLLTDCKDVVGATDADVDQFKHRITPESDAGKCMIACFNKKIKIQDPDGNINPDATRAAAETIKDLNEKWYNALLNINDKCIKEVDGIDECDIGAQWFTCVSKGQVDAGLPLLLVDA
nr:odorant-binding protein 8 [Podabrus annulatus]